MNEQIIIAMKPLNGNFVNNALECGNAGINIDGSRIKTNDSLGGGGETGAVAKHEGFRRPWMNDKQKLKEHGEKVKENVKKAENLGRFPSNIILQHHPECIKIGTKKVKGITGGGRKKSPVRKGGVHADYKGHQTVGREQSYIDYADKEGNEIIEEWDCHPECPIRIMNEQSGILETHGTGKNPKMGNIGYGSNRGKIDFQEYKSDSGGASRFFYQIKKIDESTINKETSMEVNNLFNEDCKETMKKMDENSIPFIITDPPYLLEFMGKSFDSQHHSHEGDNIGQKMQRWHEEWVREAYRVLKPGGYLVAFGGTRTYHRLACAMEDVGFEIRDTMQWIYGSGFPKSLDISKAIDKRRGVEREVIGKKEPFGREGRKTPIKGFGKNLYDGGTLDDNQVDITVPASDEAKKWDGWGTALKPAYEPIVIGMKPMEKSFVDNALNEGVAGINIDASRVATNPKVDDMLRKVNRKERLSKHSHLATIKNETNELTGVREDGRFPSNILLQHHEECKKIGTKKVKIPKHKDGYDKETWAGFGEKSGKSKVLTGKQLTRFADKDGLETIEEWECHEDCPVRIMNEQSGNSISVTSYRGDQVDIRNNSYNSTNKNLENSNTLRGHTDSGGAARFYYTAKASKGERNIGLEGMEKKKSSKMGDGIVSNVGPGLKPGKTESGDREAKNYHPTVKPIDLMRYLVNMFSIPDGGIVYDPFAGSGTTLIACKILGREYIGSEMEPEYYEIAKKRLQYDWKTWWATGKKDDFVKVKEEIKNKFFE